MPEFRTVCRAAELSPGASRTFEVAGRLIAVFRDGDEYFALDDVCPHMGASLAEGSVEHRIVTCPWHGWRFRLADGTWADNPRIKTGSHAVRVVGDEVQVEVRGQGEAS